MADRLASVQNYMFWPGIRAFLFTGSQGSTSNTISTTGLHRSTCYVALSLSNSLKNGHKCDRQTDRRQTTLPKNMQQQAESLALQKRFRLILIFAIVTIVRTLALDISGLVFQAFYFSTSYMEHCQMFQDTHVKLCIFPTSLSGGLVLQFSNLQKQAYLLGFYLIGPTLLLQLTCFLNFSNLL